MSPNYNVIIMYIKRLIKKLCKIGKKLSI